MYLLYNNGKITNDLCLITNCFKTQATGCNLFLLIYMYNVLPKTAKILRIDLNAKPHQTTHQRNVFRTAPHIQQQPLQRTISIYCLRLFALRCKQMPSYYYCTSFVYMDNCDVVVFAFCCFFFSVCVCLNLLVPARAARKTAFTPRLAIQQTLYKLYIVQFLHGFVFGVCLSEFAISIGDVN